MAQALNNVAKAKLPETVKGNVRQWARRNGHRLEPFRRMGNLALWEARCTNEGCVAGAAVAGLPPIRYGGTALQRFCPLSDVESEPETY